MCLWAMGAPVWWVESIIACFSEVTFEEFPSVRVVKERAGAWELGGHHLGQGSWVHEYAIEQELLLFFGFS